MIKVIREEMIGDSGDKLGLYLVNDCYLLDGYADPVDIEHLQITYLEKFEHGGSTSYYTNSSENFPTFHSAMANRAFDERLKKNPYNFSGKGKSIEQVYAMIKDHEYLSSIYSNLEG